MTIHDEETAGVAALEPVIDDLVRRLTLEAKVRLLSGADNFSLHADASIGLEGLVLSDGPTGVRGEIVVGGRESCLLPNASLLAQTWNPEALAEAGAILAEEAEAQRTHVVLGPTINLHRSPLGGRLFEAFSEDPLLTGRLASAYINALQERGVGASAIAALPVPITNRPAAALLDHPLTRIRRGATVAASTTTRLIGSRAPAARIGDRPSSSCR